MMSGLSPGSTASEPRAAARRRRGFWARRRAELERARAERGGALAYAASTIGARELASIAVSLLAKAERADGGSTSCLERALERTFAGTAAVTFGSGRVALWAVLRALELGPGDEVVVPGFTCVAVPAAVRAAGATPVFADVDARAYNVTAATIAARLTARTRAIVVQHTFGLPAELGPLLELARSRGIAVVEDAAHALGATVGGRPVGSFGAAAVLSFELSKCITSGMGGAAVTPDDNMAARLRAVATGCPPPADAETRRWLVLAGGYGALAPLERLTLGRWLQRTLDARGHLSRTLEDDELAGALPDGRRVRLGEAQARLLLPQLARLGRDTEHRRQIAAVYARGLGALGFAPPAIADGAAPSWLRYPFLVADRAALLARAATAGVPLGRWFESPLHPAGSDTRALGYEPGSCPRAEWLARHVVNLPTGPRVSARDASRFVRAVARWREQGSATPPAHDPGAA